MALYYLQQKRISNQYKKQNLLFLWTQIYPHRGIQKIKATLKPTIIGLIEKGDRYFGAGGALGFDTLAAQTVIELKNTYPHIKLILVLPCRNQTRGWIQKDIEIYEYIKQKADKIVYTSNEYTPDCMHKRNRHLVDHSSVCICYLTKSTGGTAYTISYAKQKGVETIYLPETTVGYET